MDIPTPYLHIDAAVLGRNVKRLADYSLQHKIGIRPHTKTHKSLFLAKLQLEHGAIGLTMAKVGEAEVMAGCGEDLLLAFPVVDSARCARLAALARERTLRVAVDSATAMDALNAAAQSGGVTIGILVDVDVGLGRTGVQSAEEALKLAQYAGGCRGLRLDGVFCYPGHVWSPAGQQLPALQAVSEKLKEVLALWRRHGLNAEIVSGGSTPTAYQSHWIPELTEIRPGTYIFNDLNTVHGGFCELGDCAARIVCSVVSNAVPGQVVVDAGSKTLAADRCIPTPESGHGCVLEYPEARVAKLSEEHGQLDVSRCAHPPKLGDRLAIIPNHICPCVNLQATVWWELDGKIEALPVDARGKLS